MGRRRLMPNFHTLLLRFHLPQRGHGTASGKVTNPSKESSSPAHPHHEEDDDDHHHPHHHHLHIFTWPSLKRKPSLSFLASSQGTHSEDDHDDAFETTHTEPTASIKTHVSSHTFDDHSQKTKVSFGNCQVRTYTQVLGDHPCCSEGCPIQLGWSYTSEESILLDEYETMHHASSVVTTKASSSSASRSIHELRLTPDERRAILLASKRQQSLIETTCESSIETSSNGLNKTEVSSCASSPSSGTTLPQQLLLHPSMGDDDDSNVRQQQQQQLQHERELIRECRRLNRCGGWNVNARASRRRNRNIQHHFFGAPHGNSSTTLTPAPAPSGEC